MKKTTAYHRLFFLFIITAGCLLLAGCEKKEDPPDMAPENWLERSYIGILTVQYTSVYPEWDVSTQMDVVIDKELGAVTIDNATLDIRERHWFRMIQRLKGAEAGGCIRQEDLKVPGMTGMFSLMQE